MFIRNYSDAKFYIKMAEQEYEAKKRLYEEFQAECEDSVMALDEKKVRIWASFSEFVDAYSKIKNLPPKLEGVVGRESIDLSVEDMDDIKVNVNIAVDIIGNLASSAVSGLAAGTATLSTAGLVGAVATMGLTWVGMPGGFAAATSMASCWMACYGLSVSPLAVVAIPAMIVGSIFLESSSKKKSDEAYKIMETSRQACRKFDEAEDYIRTIYERCEDIYEEITRLHDFYLFKVKALQEVVSVKTDYRQFTRDEQYLLASTIILVKLLKEIMVLRLIETKCTDEKTDVSDDADIAKDEEKSSQKQKKDDVPVLCPSDKIAVKIEEAKVQRLQLIVGENADLSGQLQFTQKNKEQIVIQKKYVIGAANNEIYEEARLQVANSEVYIDDTLTVYGQIEFHNCDIHIEKELFVSIKVAGGRIVFDNCRFYVMAPAKYTHILCTDGKVKINKSTIRNPEYRFKTLTHKGDKLEQSFMRASSRTEKVHVQIVDTEIVGGKGRFIETNANVRAEFTKCTVLNHQGTFVKIQSGNDWMNCGVVFTDSKFEDCTVHHKTENGRGQVVYQMAHNAIFDNHHGSLKLKRTTFEKIGTYLFNLEAMAHSEETTVEDCTFKNVRQKKIPLSGSLLVQHSLRRLIAFDQNAVIDNCRFEDCEGLETGGVTTMTYLHKPNVIRNCTFVRYAGDMFLGHVMMESCSFEDSEMTVYIEGSNEKGKSYTSVMYNCKFTACRNKEDLIRCKSYLSMPGICVSVSDCVFENCEIEYMVEDAIKVGRGKYVDVADVSGMNRIKTEELSENIDCGFKVESIISSSGKMHHVQGMVCSGKLQKGQTVKVCKTDGKELSATIVNILLSFSMVQEVSSGDDAVISVRLDGKGKVNIGDIIKAE